MKKSLTVVSSALLLAVAAAPAVPKLGYDGAVFKDEFLAGAAPATAMSQVEYPPCRPGRGDDRCIQLYERRVRAAHVHRGVGQVPARAAPMEAIGGPIEARADYPLCTTLITDECVQLFDRAPPRRGARWTSSPEDARTPGI